MGDAGFLSQDQLGVARDQGRGFTGSNWRRLMTVLGVALRSQSPAPMMNCAISSILSITTSKIWIARLERWPVVWVCPTVTMERGWQTIWIGHTVFALQRPIRRN